MWISIHLTILTIVFMGVELLSTGFWSSMMGAADHLLVGSGGTLTGGMGDRRLSAGSLPRLTCRGGGTPLNSSPVISMSLRVNGENLCSTSWERKEEGGLWFLSLSHLVCICLSLSVYWAKSCQLMVRWPQDPALTTSMPHPPHSTITVLSLSIPLAQPYL